MIALDKLRKTSRKKIQKRIATLCNGFNVVTHGIMYATHLPLSVKSLVMAGKQFNSSRLKVYLTDWSS